MYIGVTRIHNSKNGFLEARNRNSHSALSHKAKSVIDFLQNKNIKVMYYTGSSPDINVYITTKINLVEKVIYEWNYNSNLQETILKYVESMFS